MSVHEAKVVRSCIYSVKGRKVKIKDSVSWGLTKNHGMLNVRAIMDYASNQIQKFMIFTGLPYLLSIFKMVIKSYKVRTFFMNVPHVKQDFVASNILQYP